MRKYIATIFMALALLVSFTASAWTTEPTNSADITIKAGLISLYKTNSTYDVTVNFYDDTGASHLAFVWVDRHGAAANNKWYFHSGTAKTRIGYSVFPSSGSWYYKLMCPDGHSTGVVANINITKSIWTPNQWLPRDSDGGVCGSSTTPPTGNVTPISTIQSLYPGYDVVRLYADQDIFKVECMTSTGCSTTNPNSDFRGLIYYLSNTKRIGYHWSNITAGDQYRYPYVRTTEGAPDQITIDDINVLANQYLYGQYIYWVNTGSSYQYISWFNY